MTDNTVLAKELAALICRDLAELPDRTSPDDWPEAMLVTTDELQEIVNAAVSASLVLRALPTPAPAGDALREALARLEAANEALAAKRSRETYLRMIDVDGAADELLGLDQARYAARAALGEG
jgi:hypothetical protein